MRVDQRQPLLARHDVAHPARNPRALRAFLVPPVRDPRTRAASSRSGRCAGYLVGLSKAKRPTSKRKPLVFWLRRPATGPDYGSVSAGQLRLRLPTVSGSQPSGPCRARSPRAPAMRAFPRSPGNRQESSEGPVSSANFAASRLNSDAKLCLCFVPIAHLPLPRWHHPRCPGSGEFQPYRVESHDEVRETIADWIGRRRVGSIIVPRCASG